MAIGFLDKRIGDFSCYIKKSWIQDVLSQSIAAINRKLMIQLHFGICIFFFKSFNKPFLIPNLKADKPN